MYSSFIQYNIQLNFNNCSKIKGLRFVTKAISPWYCCFYTQKTPSRGKLSQKEGIISCEAIFKVNVKWCLIAIGFQISRPMVSMYLSHQDTGTPRLVRCQLVRSPVYYGLQTVLSSMKYLVQYSFSKKLNKYSFNNVSYLQGHRTRFETFQTNNFS